MRKFDVSNILFPALPVSNINFLSYAFAGLKKGEQFWVAGFPGDPMKVKPWLWGGRGAPPGLPSFIRPDHNNYIAVSCFIYHPNIASRRSKKTFSRLFMVMIDDVGTKVPNSRVTLKPSVMVETSPGNYQAWYFLTIPEPDAAKADRLIKGMIENGLTADATDPGMRGVTRYGRLPVGINGKSKYVELLGHEFVQRVTIWSPTTRYSIEEIAEAYHVNLDATETPKRHRSPAPRKHVVLTPDGEDAVLELLNRAGLYEEPLDGITGAHRVVCPWVHEHTDEDPTGTVYFEPSEENSWHGGFKCHHGHCQTRTIADLSHFMARLQELTQE